MARRGAQALNPGPDRGPSASDVWRETVARAERRNQDQAEAWEPDEVWIADPEPTAADGARPAPTGRGRTAPVQWRDVATGREGAASPGGHRHTVPRTVVDELSSTAGAQRGAKLANRIADASYAFERERYQEARRILRTLADEAPESAAVRELYGLVLYRTRQWLAAARQLEVFRARSGSFDQHPVLADCYRALHRYPEAEALWEELRAASPSGDLVAEGRIVAAGCRADQGDLAGAIATLDRAARRVAKPQDRHLRQWYALGDLYERAGDLPRARELFARVAAADPEAFGVRERLRALR